jgi:nitrate reductase assembly molybdenum cofactor insertion protein NarJ
MNYDHYRILAELFLYPTEDFIQRVDECQEVLNQKYPDSGKTLEPFTQYLRNLSQDELEELFTKTFDVQPICYLDLGYVIFGEDYKRGTFLRHMQEEQKMLGNDCSPELPDHLSHVLTMLTMHTDQMFIDELVAQAIVPGVKKMIHEFNTSRIELKIKVMKKLHNALIQEEANIGNVYVHAFEALLQVLEKDFAEAIVLYAPEIDEVSTTFLHSRNNSVNQLVNNIKMD